MNVIYFFNKSRSHKQVPADVMKELVCVNRQFMAGQLSVCVNFVVTCRLTAANIIAPLINETAEE